MAVNSSVSPAPLWPHVLAVAALLVGTSLLIFGNLSARLGWPDALHGAVTGWIVTVFSTVAYLLFCLYHSFKATSFTPSVATHRLSSRLTFYGKFFPPYYMAAVCLSVAVTSYFSHHAANIFLPLLCFFLFLVALSGYLSYTLRYVFETPASFFVLGYNSIMELDKAAVSQEGVLGLDKYLLLARLKTRTGSYFYIPALSQYFDSNL